jgi:hypothetical protein
MSKGTPPLRVDTTFGNWYWLLEILTRSRRCTAILPLSYMRGLQGGSSYFRSGHHFSTYGQHWSASSALLDATIFLGIYQSNWNPLLYGLAFRWALPRPG